MYELRSKEDWRRRQRKIAIDGTDIQLLGLPSWTRSFNHDASWFTEKNEFEKLVASTVGEGGTPKQLTVYGRPLHVPLQIEGQVARFRFADLCEQVKKFRP